MSFPARSGIFQSRLGMRVSRGVVAAFAGSLLTTPLCSQAVGLSLGAGVSVPVGDFNTVAKLGWEVTAGARLIPRDVPLGFQVDATYAQFGLDSDFDVKQQLIYGTANGVYRFRSSRSRVHPYLIAGVGVYNSKGIGRDADLFGETSETDFGLNAGAGLDFMAGGTVLFFEARFHNVFADPSNKQFFPLNLGIRFASS